MRQKATPKGTAEDNHLPDSAFLHVESGGEKDDEGKTTPRSLRHLPYKTADGEIDLPRLRNALSRLGQSGTGESGGEKWLSETLRKTLVSKAEALLEKHTNAKSEKKQARDLLATYHDITATGKEFDVQDAMKEAWDIVAACNVLSSLAQLAQQEAGEDEEETPDDMAELADLMRGVMDFIDGEIEEMIAEDEPEAAPEMKEAKQPGLIERLVNTLKAGARHSASDQDHLQQAHDHLVNAGAMCNTEKQADGHYRWTIAATGAYQDRDGEWITQKAIEKWLPTFTPKESGSMPTRSNGETLPLRWWHIEEPDIATRSKGWGIDLGTCDFAALHSKTLILSGLYDDDSIGASMKEQHDLGASINFFHPRSQPTAAKEYHDIDIFSVSLLPEAKAAYPLTGQITAKEKTDMDKQKVKELSDRIGSDAVTSLLAKVTDKEKAAELAGNTAKEADVHKHEHTHADGTTHTHEHDHGEAGHAHDHADGEAGDGEMYKAMKELASQVKEIRAILDLSEAARAKSISDQAASVKALEAKFTAAQKELKAAQAQLDEMSAEAPRGVQAMMQGYRASRKSRGLTADEVKAKGWIPSEPEADPLLSLVDRLDGRTQ